MSKLYPLKLSPVCKEIIWGGDRLKSEYGIESALSNIAESWMLTVRADGDNTIENGKCKGMKLSEYLNTEERFPLLIKLIDALDKLSIQVHPNNEYALENEGELGKTEVWYILDAKPGARLVWGLENYDKEAFKNAVEKGTLEEYMNYVPVKKGDVFFIPAGCVHAIGEGILIAEIQQSSNVTYRVYDYNRIGKDGRMRPLHTEKALDVIADYTPEEIDKLRFSLGKDENTLVNCEYFKVCKYDLDGEMSFDAREGFIHIMCIDGSGTLGGEVIKKGDSYLLPKCLENTLACGSMTLIASSAN